MSNNPELYKMVSLMDRCFQSGYMKAQKLYDPASDRISQREAYKKFGEAKIKELLDAGVISFKRETGSPNSKKYYSIEEISKALLAEENIKSGLFDHLKL